MRDGARLHVRVVGRGMPVLMLHGMGMHGGHWLPFVLPYAHRCRFYLPDLRGAGRSAAAAINQDDVFQNHREDVEDIVAHFGLDDFLLAGYSLGGSTALHWQRDGGFRRVRRYLHIDQSPCIGNREGWHYGLFGARQDVFFADLAALDALLARHPEAVHLAGLPLPAQREVAALLADTFAQVVGGRGAQASLALLARAPRLFCRLFPMQRLADLRAYSGSYLAGNHDYRDSLRGCDTPVTVFVGMNSPLYGADGQIEIARLVRDGRVVRFGRSGHVPLVDEPLKFTRELGRFLAGDN